MDAEFRNNPSSDYLEITKAVIVPCDGTWNHLLCCSVHIFWSLRIVGFSLFIWKRSISQPDALRHERCSPNPVTLMNKINQTDYAVPRDSFCLITLKKGSFQRILNHILESNGIKWDIQISWYHINATFVKCQMF